MWRFLRKLEIELPYDPAIPLLGIHTEETRIERDTCTPMSMSALERNPQVPAPTPHKVLGTDIDGRGIPRGPKHLSWGLAFPEATRAGP